MPISPTYLHKRGHTVTYRGSVNTKSKHRRVEVPGRVTRVGWTPGNLLEISFVAGRLPTQRSSERSSSARLAASTHWIVW